MYKLTFTLKQHTPIIHFQHDQDGATLRATEVKPKLDRFIISNCGGIKACRESHPGWFSTDMHDALDYKLRIEDSQNGAPIPIEYEERNNKFRPLFPFVFGNLENRTQKKVFRFSESIQLKFIIKSGPLKETISTYISEFFLLHNFGFRQTKGFGCFTVSDQHNFRDRPYSFTIKLKEFSSAEEKYHLLFKEIELLYKTLRSGINTSNFGGIYFKSMMFMYAKSDAFREQWDKRTIREKLYSSHQTYKRVKTNRTDENGTVNYSAPNKNNLLFRDILGLSTEQDWMNYGEETTDSRGQTKFRTDKVTKESVNNRIDRFESPILFKPVILNDDTFRVYLVANSIPEAFLNHTFEIKSKSYPGNNFSAKTPQNFDISDFLDFCFKRCFKTDQDVQNHIQGDRGKEEARSLIRIYSELRKSK